MGGLKGAGTEDKNFETSWQCVLGAHNNFTEIGLNPTITHYRFQCVRDADNSDYVILWFSSFPPRKMQV